MSRFQILALVALSATWSTQASAGQFAWCQVDAGGTRYLTGIIEIEDGSESLNALESDRWSEAFEDHVKAITGRRGVGHADCWAEKTMYEAKTFIRDSMTYTGVEWQQTGWLGGRPAATEGASTEPRSSGASILVEDRKPTAAASEPQAPMRPKKSNAQADAEYAAALAVYERQMAAHRQQVEDYERAQDEFARTKEEQQLAAERVLAAHRKEVEKAEVEQSEYRKELAKPAGVPSAIYRGFTGRNCDEARRSAVRGAGTTAGTQFREVRTEMSESGTCLVQGWWWNTGEGGASRQ